MKIAIGCDEAAYHLKETIKEHLLALGHEPADFGCFSTEPVQYPDVAFKIAKEIQGGNFERGILLCGTGIGMCITANKVKGVRAALCHDCYSAERSRKSNDAQIITMGARVIGPELAKSIISVWLESEFQGGKSADKITRIQYYEQTEFQGETDDEEAAKQSGSSC
jgi:ribose 5-phosphate isomerase B